MQPDIQVAGNNTVPFKIVSRSDYVEVAWNNGLLNFLPDGGKPISFWEVLGLV